MVLRRDFLKGIGAEIGLGLIAAKSYGQSLRNPRDRLRDIFKIRPFGIVHKIDKGIIYGCATDPHPENPLHIRFYSSQSQSEIGESIGFTSPFMGDEKCSCQLQGERFAFKLPEKVKDMSLHYIRLSSVKENDGIISESLLNNIPFPISHLYPSNNPDLSPFYSPFRSHPDDMKSEYLITSPDGNVQIGVSKLFGGAINYLNNKRIQDTGNMIDYSNAGTLLSTALWLLPLDNNERMLCHDFQKEQEIFPGTLPFKNPTQGGYIGNGWAGNPNFTSITMGKDSIRVKTRLVNYNFAFYAGFTRPDGKSPYPDESNMNEWQTDFYSCLNIYFHPGFDNLVVVDTTITYDPGCVRNDSCVTQDNQLSTLFGMGQSHPDQSFRGPYTRAVKGSVNQGISQLEQIAKGFNADENWAAILKQKQDVGIGISIQDYQPTDPGRFGISLTNWPSICSIQPEINKFHHAGVFRKENVTINGDDYSDIARYQFMPGGNYTFRTYIKTGSLSEIGETLKEASYKRLPLQPSVF